MSLATKDTTLNLNDREQIQYLLGNTPSWMMQYGITVIAGFFGLLLILSYIIHYPDVLEAEVTLTTERPPIRILAHGGGTVSELLVTDRQAVKEEEVLAVLENPANWKDVLLLETRLEHYTIGNPDTLPAHLDLGNLQHSYSEFSQHWKDFLYFSNNHNTESRIEGLNKQIRQLQEINNYLLKQQEISRQEYALAVRQRDRQLQLHRDKLISDLEFEKDEEEWLYHKRKMENEETSLLQNNMQIRQLQNQINELHLTKSDNTNEKILTMHEDIQRLRSEIAAWKHEYLVVAPIDGKVSFSKIWSIHQSIDHGQEIMAVIPFGTSDQEANIIGKAILAGDNIGEIMQGSRAIIHLDAYPVQQYGALEGVVTNIGAIPYGTVANINKPTVTTSTPQKKGYQIDIELPNTLLTTYGKSIPFRQEMGGKVRVIADDRRVIERIFDKLYDILENK